MNLVPTGEMAQTPIRGAAEGLPVSELSAHQRPNGEPLVRSLLIQCLRAGWLIQQSNRCTNPTAPAHGRGTPARRAVRSIFKPRSELPSGGAPR